MRRRPPCWPNGIDADASCPRAERSLALHVCVAHRRPAAAPRGMAEIRASILASPLSQQRGAELGGGRGGARSPSTMGFPSGWSRCMRPGLVLGMARHGVAATPEGVEYHGMVNEHGRAGVRGVGFYVFRQTSPDLGRESDEGAGDGRDPGHFAPPELVYAGGDGRVRSRTGCLVGQWRSRRTRAGLGSGWTRWLRDTPLKTRRTRAKMVAASRAAADWHRCGDVARV